MLSGIRPLAPVDVPLLDALGLVCAEDVVATMSLPSFDNSAMDGYAVRSADVAGASAEQPVLLPVVGEIGAGQAGPRTLAPGTAAKIMTGAPIPDGADAVVPYEWTDRGTAKVRIDEAPEPGQHVRPAGDDVAVGDLLVEGGHGAQRPAHRAARVGGPGDGRWPGRGRGSSSLSTGTELRDPGEELGEDSIYDGNSYMLAAAVTRAGGGPAAGRHRPRRAGRVPRDAARHAGGRRPRRHLRRRLPGRLRRREGGAAPRGRLVRPGRDAARQAAGVRPPRRRRKVPIVTLPGNSVSAYISFEVFVLPAIRTLMGLAPVSRPLLEARLTRGMTSPEGRRQFMRGQVGVDAEGRYVEPVGGPGSHLIGAPGGEQRLIVVPEDDHRPRAGRPGAGAGAGRRVLAPMATEDRLTHVDETGAARMVDVSDKDVTARTATATGRVLVSPEVVELLRGEGVPKGDALAVARLAGIMGAKQTPALIPLCHPLAISGVTVDLTVTDESVDITATVKTTDRTGVEMEALTAVSVAALTVVDMVKAVDKAAVITDVRVEAKSGGRSGDWSR